MQRLDAAILDMRNVHAVDGDRAVWRASPPVQTPDPVVAERRAMRSEGEVRRQAGEQLGHRIRDRSVALSYRLWLVQYGIFGIELAYCLDALCGVALVEHAEEVCLHQAGVVDGCF